MIESQRMVVMVKFSSGAFEIATRFQAFPLSDSFCNLSFNVNWLGKLHTNIIAKNNFPHIVSISIASRAIRVMIASTLYIFECMYVCIYININIRLRYNRNSDGTQLHQKCHIVTLGV